MMGRRITLCYRWDTDSAAVITWSAKQPSEVVFENLHSLGQLRIPVEHIHQLSDQLREMEKESEQ